MIRLHLITGGVEEFDNFFDLIVFVLERMGGEL